MRIKLLYKIVWTSVILCYFVQTCFLLLDNSQGFNKNQPYRNEKFK
jgi:hypothetical protein